MSVASDALRSIDPESGEKYEALVLDLVRAFQGCVTFEDIIHVIARAFDRSVDSLQTRTDKVIIASVNAAIIEALEPVRDRVVTKETE